MNEEIKDHTFSFLVENKDVYKMAIDARNFEVSMFWQRSNYFLVLNTAIALGFFNLQKPEFTRIYSLVLAGFGILVSYLWYQVNLGAKFWQCRWEQRLLEVENILIPGAKFFAADHSTILTDVQNSLSSGPKKSGFRRWLDKQILSKPSVSHSMILLSLLFLFGWIVVIATYIFVLPAHA